MQLSWWGRKSWLLSLNCNHAFVLMAVFLGCSGMDWYVVCDCGTPDHTRLRSSIFVFKTVKIV